VLLVEEGTGLILNKMYLKIHSSGGKEVVAICDKELIGKEFNDGYFCLNINLDFYQGDLKKQGEIKNILLNAKNINIVGEKSVKLAVDLGVVDKNSIFRIENIPFVFVFEI